MKTFTEVAEWCRGAADAFGDPSVPVCQLFFRYLTDLDICTGDALSCTMIAGDLVLVLGGPPRPVPLLPLPVRTGKPDVTDDEVITYGAVRVVEGVWAITPSLNVEGFIHGFVVVYGVPDPAPWDRLIVLP